MNTYIKPLLFGGVVGLMLILFLNKKEIEYIEVPVEIELEIPIIEKEFDTIYLPSPIKEKKPQIDSTYYKEYIKLKDSITRDSIFKKAITIREYKPRFEDDSIIIDVYTKTRGTLLESQITYKTKPRNIVLDTTLLIKVPRRSKLYVGGSIYLDTDEKAVASPGIGPEMSFLNKKQTKIISFGYDAVNKKGRIGVVFKL